MPLVINSFRGGDTYTHIHTYIHTELVYWYGNYVAVFPSTTLSLR